MTFPLRAVELHGQRMWERERVLKVLGFMERHQLNTLVLHESDLVHQIVYPRAYFDPYALWSDLPSRRGENAIFNKRAYFARLLKMAGDAGISVWVNVKEIGFSDEVLAIHPEVIKDGVFCPSEPFWTEYVGHKTAELFDDFPQLAGMIVSFGSQESRASRVQNRCRCSLCASEPLDAWYARLISTLHAPIRARGKQLAVRDFAYKPADHAPLVRAVAAAPPDVIFCIKAMPHDFYLTFPDNPAIGQLERRQFVEYDVLGQFFGWGLMPCFVLEDLRSRVPGWRRAGVDGVILRIEWERINDLDCLDTLNETNLVAAAAWARGDCIDGRETCRRWLADRGWDEQSAGWLASVLEQTPEIVRGAAYVDGFVSADNSMLPRSVERAWWGMEVRDSLAVWNQSRAQDLVLDAGRMEQLLREKDESLAAARRLAACLHPAVPEVHSEVQSHVRERFAWFDRWVEGLGLCAKVCLYARWLATDPAGAGSDAREAMRDGLAELEGYAARMEALLQDTAIPHQVAMLLDPLRARDVLREGRVFVNTLDSRQRPE